ncbi:UxaA family hydrolase [Haladaptatus salinisoli]|uniref:UxaA family hydrolase n=1 Tax=Haladaptatus salinisoli TaxID=2884876 RepID=UPI001D0BDEC1|nr:UxaA family hydrolase [Haladaptatus salinisoli]
MKGIVLDDVALLMTGSDNVATVLDDVDAGRTIEYEGDTITLDERVSFGHKIALTDISEGETVQKYGEVIGRMTQDVIAGEWVHTHNCESTRGRGDRAAKEGTV